MPYLSPTFSNLIKASSDPSPPRPQRRGHDATEGMLLVPQDPIPALRIR
jgi:hypothetical protein